jgi:hypothetical protein
MESRIELLMAVSRLQESLHAAACERQARAAAESAPRPAPLPPERRRRASWAIRRVGSR